MAGWRDIMHLMLRWPTGKKDSGEEGPAQQVYCVAARDTFLSGAVATDKHLSGAAAGDTLVPGAVATGDACS